MTFEFPPTGGGIPFQAVSSIRLLKYIDRSDYIMMGAELIFIIFIAYYIIEEGLEIKAHGLAHFKKATNWMDIVVIVVFTIWFLAASIPAFNETGLTYRYHQFK